MRFLDKLERRLGWIAIGNLPVYVVSAQGIIYLWTLLNPGQEAWLTMDPQLVMAGEYWRILTFLFLIPFSNPLFTLFYLYFQFVCGRALEDEWGSFRLTVFWLTGALGCIVASFIVGGDLSAAFYLNDTIFLAFAALHPDYQILFMGLIPMKVKWLAWVTWILQVGFGLWFASNLLRVAILISLSNYFLFFGREHVMSIVGRYQRWQHRRRYKDFIE